jgi:hypothetical protein
VPDSEYRDLFSALDVAGFRREAEDRFTPITRLPPWAEPFLGPAGSDQTFTLARQSYFLEHFLVEAEVFWKSGEEGVLRSCSWSEPIFESLGEQLQATAISVAGKGFLVIRPVGQILARQHGWLQRGREVRLQYELETKEFEQKEVLVHCIIHDLANPLTGVSGALQMLETEPLGDHAKRLVKLAWEACQRQRSLIEQVLDVFSAEAEGLHGKIDPRQAPDLSEVATESLQQMTVFLERYDLNGFVHVEPGRTGPCRVLAERSRLGRVFANLLENAVRHAPRGTDISIHIAYPSAEQVEVRVEDRGAGVPEKALPYLFEKFAPAKGGVRGKAGLGLYFCRITVERWEGQIGYRRAEGGGACFWFRLLLAEPA